MTENPPSFTPGQGRVRPKSDSAPTAPATPPADASAPPPPPSISPKGASHRPPQRQSVFPPVSQSAQPPPPIEPTLVAAPMPAAIPPARKKSPFTAQPAASPQSQPYRRGPSGHAPAGTRASQPQSAPKGRAPKRRRRGSRRRKVMGVLVLVLVVIIAWPTWLIWHTNASMHRIDATSTAPNTRGTTYLFAGSDTRDGWNPDDPTEGQRSDSTILVHRAPNGQASMVSLPRDSYVNIPGYGMNKLNAAFAYGGPSLLIETVEEATGLHVDHYVQIGMVGVTDTIDALGSVELCWDADVSDEFSGMQWTAGCHRANGEEALAFSRMRYSDPTGDVGRQQRQRQVMNAVVSEALSPAVLINPVKQYRLSEAAANALTVGQDTNIFNVATLMMAMRKATADGLVGMPPIASVDAMNEAGAVMLWDEAAVPTFFENMKNGTLTQEDFVLPQ